jgi:hypothetical protein
MQILRRLRRCCASFLIWYKSTCSFYYLAREMTMHCVFYDQVHNVLRLDFEGHLTTADLDAIDPAITGILKEQDRSEVRVLYDMTHIEALAVPQLRFAQRARLAPIGKSMRVVVAPPWASHGFGKSYRDAQRFSAHSQPLIVPHLHEAYRVLALVDPKFQPRIGPFTAMMPLSHRDEGQRYVVQISRRGSLAEPFGWEIYQEANLAETHRSTRTFSTRVEALLDSVRTAAALDLDVVDALADSANITRH